MRGNDALPAAARCLALGLAPKEPRPAPVLSILSELVGRLRPGSWGGKWFYSQTPLLLRISMIEVERVR